ncbi:MAG TPA: DUF1080 domain-containing protein [Gemmataceae bacterium]|nr:DUF1080 domain-containing protein [Gemmataceae bacterium]
MGRLVLFGAINLALLALAGMTSHAIAQSKAGENGWVQLFNGKDLTGWKTHPDFPGKWEVINGILVGNSPEISFLYSERGDYQHFHVRMEAKTSERCDSGLFFRAQMPGNGDGPYKKAGKKGGIGGGGGRGYPEGYYEAQINNYGGGKGGGGAGALTGTLMVGGGGKGDGKTTYSKKLVGADEWFKLEIIAQGNRIRILVNGTQTVDYIGDATGKTLAYTKGHFAIQSKAPLYGDSPQIIYVKSFEIKELPR